mgnify:CR=1 FL=1
MQANLSQIVKEAFKTQAQDFNKLVEKATQLLSKENGKIGNQDVLGRLVRLKPYGEAVVVGDLHGDLESLVEIVKESNILQRMEKTGALTIFLGDYGDRGVFSAEVYYAVLKLKLFFPEQVILMRGNHEGPEDLLAKPHDLPDQFEAKFGPKWQEAYAKIRELFNYLYTAVLVEERCLMVHGGFPFHASTVSDLAYAHVNHPKQRFLEDMLWSDPSEDVQQTSKSPRGAGKLFGKKTTKQMLSLFNVKFLIRGHESCEEGFKIDHDGKVLTLFSCKGQPYFNAYGAYLDFQLSEKINNVHQLVPCIHKFKENSTIAFLRGRFGF